MLRFTGDSWICSDSASSVGMDAEAPTIMQSKACVFNASRDLFCVETATISTSGKPLTYWVIFLSPADFSSNTITYLGLLLK